MSLNPRLTMIDMYNYDNTLFDMVSFPSEAGIDHDLFVNNLLVTYGEQRVIYPNIPFFKLASRVWSQKWEQSILRIVRTLSEDYDPLYNYDRTETETITDEGQEKTTFGNTHTTTFNTLNTIASSGQDKITYADTETTNHGSTQTTTYNSTETTNHGETETTTYNITDTESKEEVGEGSRSGTTETENEGTVEYEVSAYNQASYQPDRKETRAGSDTVTVNEDNDNTVTTDAERSKTGTETLAHSGVDSVAHTGTDSVAHTGTDSVAHTGTDTTDKTGSGTDAKTGTEATAQTGADTVDTGNERSRELRAYGNIGVTTSQAMLKEEMMIRKNVNLYDVLAEMFFREFCVYVY